MLLPGLIIKQLLMVSAVIVAVVKDLSQDGDHEEIKFKIQF